MEIKPLHDHIVIKQIKEPTETKSGIYIGEAPEDTQLNKSMIYGEVLKIGPGRYGYETKQEKRCGMWGLKEGDKVAFSPNGNTKFNLDGEEVLMIRRDAIIGLHFGEEVNR